MFKIKSYTVFRKCVGMTHISIFGCQTLQFGLIATHSNCTRNNEFINLMREFFFQFVHIDSYKV